MNGRVERNRYPFEHAIIMCLEWRIILNGCETPKKVRMRTGAIVGMGATGEMNGKRGRI